MKASSPIDRIRDRDFSLKPLTKRLFVWIPAFAGMTKTPSCPRRRAPIILTLAYWSRFVRHSELFRVVYICRCQALQTDKQTPDFFLLVRRVRMYNKVDSLLPRPTAHPTAPSHSA